MRVAFTKNDDILIKLSLSLLVAHMQFSIISEVNIYFMNNY